MIGTPYDLSSADGHASQDQGSEGSNEPHSPEEIDADQHRLNVDKADEDDFHRYKFPDLQLGALEDPELMLDLFGEDYFKKKTPLPRKPQPTKGLFGLPVAFGFTPAGTQAEERPLDKFIEENQDLLGGNFKLENENEQELEQLH